VEKRTYLLFGLKCIASLHLLEHCSGTLGSVDLGILEMTPPMPLSPNGVPLGAHNNWPISHSRTDTALNHVQEAVACENHLTPGGLHSPLHLKSASQIIIFFGFLRGRGQVCKLLFFAVLALHRVVDRHIVEDVPIRVVFR
jgi:hypothetical protein